MAKVLIIDDSQMVRQEISLYLKEAGYEVTEAVDGVEGLELIEGQDFDLILCDINMPRLSGLELLRHMDTPDGKDLPIVMVTTQSCMDSIREAQERGAKGWLIKPFSRESILAIAEKVVESGQAA